METRLDDIAEISQGSILTRIEDKQGTPFETITMAELSYYTLQSDTVPQTKQLFTRDKNVDKCTFTEKDDVLIGLSSAKAMVIEESRVNKLVPSNFALIRIRNRNAVDPYYLCWLFNENTQITRKLSSLFQSTSRVFIIPLSTLKDLIIDLPDIEQQRKIGKVYDLSRRITRINRRLISLQATIINAQISELNTGGNVL